MINVRATFPSITLIALTNSKGFFWLYIGARRIISADARSISTYIYNMYNILVVEAALCSTLLTHIHETKRLSAITYNIRIQAIDERRSVI